MAKLLSLFLASSLILGGIAGCSSDGKSRVELGNEQGIMHMGNGDEPADVDPHTTTGMPEYRIQVALFEGLVSKDAKTLETIPGVAKSWDISDDRLTYTFNINENAKWSNGDAMSAHDFVYSWKRALQPELGNQYAYSLDIIKNAQAYRKGELDDFTQVGITAVDDMTLRVDLNAPTPYFLQLLDHHSMYPVHKGTIEAHGTIGERGTKWTRPENFVGNGPFTMKEWKPNSVLSVQKNTHYWNAAAIKLNEVHYYPIQQPATAERMFRAGQLHFVETLQTSKIEVYKKENPEVYRNYPYFGTYFYRFNTTRKPFNDVRVRKALTYSIDRSQITDLIMKGGQVPAFNLTPPGTKGYTASAKVKHDPELAKQLMAEAGYPNGEGFPTITILYNTQEQHKKIAVAIQQMLKKNLNINIALENQDWKVFLSNQRQINFDMARGSWIGDYYDPNTFLDMFLTGGGNNETGWSSTEYDRLISLAANSSTQQERYGYFQQAESILVDEVPILPVYTYATNRLIATSVKGWQNNLMDYYSFKNVYLESTQI